jgi:hypothetical protein
LTFDCRALREVFWAEIALPVGMLEVMNAFGSPAGWKSWMMSSLALPPNLTRVLVPKSGMNPFSSGSTGALSGRATACWSPERTSRRWMACGTAA